jgi:glycosyltransferase involved in cell wall biosynthesis
MARINTPSFTAAKQPVLTCQVLPTSNAVIFGRLATTGWRDGPCPLSWLRIGWTCYIGVRHYAGQIEWAVRAADHISAVSNATRQDLIERLKVPPDKVTTIYNAANPVYLRSYDEAEISDTLARYDLPRDFILFVGTLEPRKNLPTLIRAFNIMREELAIDVPLVLAGDKGWIYEEIFATIEALNLSDNVRHIGGLTVEQLAHLYSAAGLLALPSFHEGFGLPVLEAMWCGCPVVVSNTTSLPEVAGGAGLLLPPDDVEAWAEAMARTMTDNQLREEMVTKGHAQARRFSWRNAAEATLRLYGGD